MSVDELRAEIEEIKRKIGEIMDRQMVYMGKHHELDKEIIELRSDLKHLIKGFEGISTNLNRLMMIVVGGFLTALVGFIAKTSVF